MAICGALTHSSIISLTDNQSVQKEGGGCNRWSWPDGSGAFFSEKHNLFFINRVTTEEPSAQEKSTPTANLLYYTMPKLVPQLGHHNEMNSNESGSSLKHWDM